jgi:hypothetical protein
VNADEFADDVAIADVGVGDITGYVFLVLGLNPEGREGKDVTVGSDGGTTLHDDVGPQGGVLADDDVWSNGAKWPYLAAIFDLRFCMYNCKLVYLCAHCSPDRVTVMP